MEYQAGGTTSPQGTHLQEAHRSPDGCCVPLPPGRGIGPHLLQGQGIGVHQPLKPTSHLDCGAAFWMLHWGKGQCVYVFMAGCYKLRLQAS